MQTKCLTVISVINIMQVLDIDQYIIHLIDNWKCVSSAIIIKVKL